VEPRLRHDRFDAGQPGRDESMETDQDVRILELEAELARKDALLREVDHRVKNNLQLISSLMLL
jgi:two-component sensor histidine kinase